jgi:hypothetical protein
MHVSAVRRAREGLVNRIGGQYALTGVPARTNGTKQTPEVFVSCFLCADGHVEAIEVVEAIEGRGGRGGRVVEAVEAVEVVEVASEAAQQQWLGVRQAFRSPPGATQVRVQLRYNTSTTSTHPSSHPFSSTSTSNRHAITSAASDNNKLAQRAREVSVSPQIHKTAIHKDVRGLRYMVLQNTEMRRGKQVCAQTHRTTKHNTKTCRH